MSAPSFSMMSGLYVTDCPCLHPAARSARTALRLAFTTAAGLVGALLLFVLAVCGSPSDAFALRDPPFVLPPRAELAHIRSAILSTDRGDVIFDLFPDVAPWHVANLKFLADQGFYRNLPLKVVGDGYVIQGGVAPPAWRGRVSYSIPPEFSEVKHVAGTLGMARFEDVMNPARRSSSSVFQIVLEDNPRMDGNYSAFGRVRHGLEVLKGIRDGELIRDLTVYVQRDAPEESRQ